MARKRIECNNDCFHCIFDDCIKDGITREERSVISLRDKLYSNGNDALVLKGKANKSKNRRKR